MNTDIDRIIDKAATSCAEKGGKLTEKREKILRVLLNSAVPLSAYEIVDNYSDNYGDKVPAMSVYRMLEFLMQQKLVHKLATTNKYVACGHISCDHQHEVPQFLICNECQTVTEAGVKKAIIEELDRSVTKTGFQLTSQQLELYGLCSHCQAKT